MMNYERSTSSSDRRANKRRVQFADMSSMVLYNDDGDVSATHYSETDISQFKIDALCTACKIRSSLKLCSMDDHDNGMMFDQDNIVVEEDESSPLETYAMAWKRLPELLEDANIDQEDAIGIEQLIVNIKIAKISLALRGSNVAMLLDEQSDQRSTDRGSEFENDPRTLARVVKPISKLTAGIAYARAVHVAYLH